MHRLLVDKKLAPKLLHLDKIAGGWFVVIMDFVEGTHIDAETAATNDHVKNEEFPICFLLSYGILYADFVLCFLTNGGLNKKSLNLK